jgi:hypothetical protein
MRSAIRIALTTWAVAVFASVGRGQELADRSPFLPEGGTVAAAPTENAPLELRGIVETSGGYLYGIFDPGKRQSSWVRLNDGGDFAVRSHDVQNDTITVEYQGRSLTLALKAAKVESIGPAPNPVQVNAPRPGFPGGPVVINPTPADEARRLEGVAAEVRRRRMLRQAAAQQAAQGQPPAIVQPGPQPVQPGPQAGAPQPR